MMEWDDAPPEQELLQEFDTDADESIDYAAQTYQQLADWLSDYLKTKAIICERGHRECGCVALDPAPCVLAVIGEIEARRPHDYLKVSA